MLELILHLIFRISLRRSVRFITLKQASTIKHKVKNVRKCVLEPREKVVVCSLKDAYFLKGRGVNRVYVCPQIF